MDDVDWPTGGVGRARNEYAGMFVQVELDPSGSGWHIWVSDADPRDAVMPLPGKTWDVWADTRQDVLEWLSGELLDVEWLDE